MMAGTHYSHKVKNDFDVCKTSKVEVRFIKLCHYVCLTKYDKVEIMCTDLNWLKICIVYEIYKSYSSLIL